MPECEACKNGLGEPWEKFVESLVVASPKLLEKAWITWSKRTLDYERAGCRKHADEASDRRDYIPVSKDSFFSSGKMTPTQWIEGRKRLRNEKK